MTRKILATLLFVSFGLLIGCNDNDNVTPPEPQDSLNGTWNLVNFTGGDFGGSINIDYNLDEKLWIFDTENTTITTVDNLNPESSCLICNTTFFYILETNEEDISFVSYAYLNDDNVLQVFKLLGEVTTLTDTTLVLTDTDPIINTVRTFIKEL